MPKMKKTWIYLIGVIVFGLSYAWLKTLMSELVFFGVVIGYLVLLRLLAEKFGK
jgi:apolipoprotein N-acyltransferase